MIFFDRSIPKSVATALQQVRSDIIWLEDRFTHDTKDAIWLKEAGISGWVVVTRDKKIRTRPGERQAVVDHSVGCFTLAQKKDMNRWEMLRIVVKTLDEMEELFRSTPRPFIYTVNSSGAFRPVRL